MKVLLLIRHAKSSWDSAFASDFDRPLNGRGKKDAPMMAQKLLEKKVQVDAFVSSPAKRAMETAAYFVDTYGHNKAELIQVPELYLAEARDFVKVVKGLNNEYDNVAVFSHNPGITDFANSLCKVDIDDMPTCSIFAVSSPANAWSDFILSKNEFLFFDYPKLQP